jgi:cysteine desulfurase
MTIYLDHAATTPLRPEALEVLRWQLEMVGNPSSVHQFGQSARRVLEEARESIAETLDCNRSEVIFTSGGTESDNLAIKGLFWQQNQGDARKRLIVSAYTEHHAVIDAIEWLENEQGAEAIWLPVSPEGVVDIAALEKLLVERAGEVALITLMWANNETGVLTDIRAVTELASKFGIPVHSDAVAALGHTEISFAKSGLSAISISAHKVGGPVGVGALLVARSAKLTSLTHGGGQERGMRSGTMNSAGAAAFARAAQVAKANQTSVHERLAPLVSDLRDAIEAAAPEARFSRGEAAGLLETLHYTFEGCSGDSLLFMLDSAGVAVSTGSACTAGVASASHVLLAMGRSEREATGTLRISLGYTTTQADVSAFIDAFPAAHVRAKLAGLAAG